MIHRCKDRTSDKILIKLFKIPLLALLIFIAAVVGIQAGDFLYSLDTSFIDEISTENLKKMVGISFPIIESIYNSGKSSVSFPREIRNFITGVFNFNLDSPISILNVQSPIFMSYYQNKFKAWAGCDDEIGEDRTSEAGVWPFQNSYNIGAFNGLGVDSDKSESDNNGKNNTDDSGDSFTEGAFGNETLSQNGDKYRTGSAYMGLYQPISSVFYESEEEDEDDSYLIALDTIVVRNFTNHEVDVAKLLREPIDFDFSAKGPKVLIYHTHTSESYVLKEEDLDNKDVPSYNSDPQYNVVRVGEELARCLRKYDIETLHNGTVHDKVRSAAYGAAVSTLENYLKSYPSIKIYIDIHRDGLESNKPKLRVAKEIDGKDAARIMFVVGTNDQLPNARWQENLKLALKLQQKLNEKYPGLTRPLWVVGKRYNQHIPDFSILVEVGGDGNLLSEGLESMKYLAEALNAVMSYYSQEG